MLEEVEILWQEFMGYLSDWTHGKAEGLPMTFEEWSKGRV